MKTLKLKDLKYVIPPRKFCHGDKVMISLRLHSGLKEEIESLADEMGWASTDVIITAIDQFVAFVKSQKQK
jgi:hypothetical protein